MLWDDKKTPDESWGEVMNDGQGIYLDQNQTLKLLTGHSGALRGTPHGFVDRQSISVRGRIGKSHRDAIRHSERFRRARKRLWVGGVDNNEPLSPMSKSLRRFRT